VKRRERFGKSEESGGRGGERGGETAGKGEGEGCWDGAGGREREEGGERGNRGGGGRVKGVYKRQRRHERSAWRIGEGGVERKKENCGGSERGEWRGVGSGG